MEPSSTAFLRKDPETVDAFSAFADRYVSLARDAGFPIRSADSESLPIFSALDKAAQRNALASIGEAVELLDAAFCEGEPITDSRKLLWRLLGRSGWTPCSDLFETIGDGDTIEVFSREQVQVFRNLEYFRYGSFTLEELYCIPWYELVSRDSGIESTLLDVVTELLSGRVSRTLSLEHLPEHEIREVAGKEHRRFRMRLRHVSPVFRDGEVVAIVATHRLWHIV